MDAVFHLPEGHPERHDRLLRNVGNLLDDDTVSLDSVAVVANGSGVTLLLEDATRREDVLALADRGVAFKACRNTLEGANRSADELLSGVEVVPSGVGELARLQDAGYAYIRP